MRCPRLALQVSYAKYAGPEQRFCPAAVYEYNVPEGKEGGEPQLVRVTACSPKSTSVGV